MFATDIDSEALARARAGVYPAAIVTDVPPSRLRSAFTADGGGFRVHKGLRDNLVFAEHNVLHDPPFSRLHLVSCRNLLIYLDRAAQQDVLEMFHFSMRPGGYLFLGSSETVDASSRLFAPVDKAMRLYRANPVSRPLRTLHSRVLGGKLPIATVSRSREHGPTTAASVHRELLDEFGPPTVLANAEGQIVHVSKRATRYLRYSAGEPTHVLVQSLPSSCGPPGAPSWSKCFSSKTQVIADSVTIDAQRAPDAGPALGAARAPPLLARGDAPGRVRRDGRCGRGLASARPAPIPRLAAWRRNFRKRNEQLRTTIEQYESASEELKASNEELQAINEELRSTTEELETSKEELQSTNEELVTVNGELKIKRRPSRRDKR